MAIDLAGGQRVHGANGAVEYAWLNRSAPFDHHALPDQRRQQNILRRRGRSTGVQRGQQNGDDSDRVFGAHHMPSAA
ncbi:MAG TPA: hypothetical protein VFB36_12885 [Nevskiaceae bacterium]|nr:hypothetical protein [Nevskiaceae bacterium]